MSKLKMISVLLAAIISLFIHAGAVFGDPVDALSVDANGNVGIGTLTPQALLHLETDSELDGCVNSGIRLQNTYFSSTSNIFLSNFYIDWLDFEVNDNLVLILGENGDAVLTGMLTENSDSSLKENIKKIDSSLEKITRLRGVTYDWKDKEKRGDKPQIGLIAEEVEEVFSEAVIVDAKGHKSIGYTRLVAPLVEAVKELKSENESLKNMINDLTSRVIALEQKEK